MGLERPASHRNFWILQESHVNRRTSFIINYSYPVELFTTVLLVAISLGLGVGLLIYGVRGTRESQARDGRTYKRGRL
jgi:hypothetical protein